jgi:hypothetical protein
LRICRYPETTLWGDPITDEGVTSLNKMLKIRGQGVAACVSGELTDGTGIVKEYDFSLTVRTVE